MPSPFYGTDAVYGLRALLGTSNISDIDAGFGALRDDVAAKMKGAVPRVSALPTVGPSGSGALVDGQECYLIADATNGVQWHLRYNAGSGSTYKWEFIGGPPLLAYVAARDVITASNTTPGDGANVVSLTLPIAGDFRVFHGASIEPPTTAMQYAEALITIAGAQQAPTASIVVNPASITFQTDASRLARLNGLASGSVLKQQYLGTGAATIAMSKRYVEVQPYRVG